MKLQELIQEIQSMEGSSRKMDSLIYAYSNDALDWQRDAYEVPNHARFAPRWRTKFRNGKPKETDDELPKFTADTDVSMSMIPKGWSISTIEFDSIMSGKIEVKLVNQVELHKDVIAYHDSLPIAICIASLMALEEGEC